MLSLRQLTQILDMIVTFPVQLCIKYVRILSAFSRNNSRRWQDLLLSLVEDETVRIEHQSPEGKIGIVFHTPNEVCRFRALTFSDKEPETLEWIEEFGGSGAFVDVGANVGLYSIYFAQIKAGSVYAIEPSVFNLPLLTKNIVANGLQDRITTFPFALYDRNFLGDLQLTDLLAGSAMNSFVENVGHDGETLHPSFRYRTVGFSLDFLVESGIIPEVPTLLKLDVDGIEDLILEGSVRTIADPILRSVLVEVNDGFDRLATSVDSILTRAGLQLHRKKHAAMFDGSPYARSFNQIWVRP